MSQEPFCVAIYRIMPHTSSRTRSLCGNNMKMHTDIAEEKLRVEIYRKNAGRLSAHRDQTPALCPLP